MTTDTETIREALYVLYAYTSDDANPPGAGRSESYAEGRAALGRVEEREREIEQAFVTLCGWLLEHLDGWDVGDDMEWDRQVVASMRCIVTGEPGCTEEADYTPEQWAALQVVRAALAGSVAAGSGEE